MSRSRKRTPISYWAGCKSQKRGKRVCNRRFRRKVHQRIAVGDMDNLPFLTREIMDTWDLGGDGKFFYHAEPSDEYFIRLMRK